MESFWVSLLIQDKEDRPPYLVAMSNGCFSLDQAKEVVKRGQRDYRVLSAWIDMYDIYERKTIVFHECYVNSMGQLCS